jgi:uncharacterized protein (TIGR00730 family)
MTRVCVYCGSNVGARPGYARAAASLGAALVARGLELVYGGGQVGLMGVVADAVLGAGGRAVGVIPAALVARDVAHRGLSELKVVASMHERKAVMAELADAFVALPGGLGTLEEFSEAATWTQLGLHRKACGLLNVEGYYDALLALLDRAVADRFVRPAHRAIIVADADPGALLDRLAAVDVPQVSKLIDRDRA